MSYPRSFSCTNTLWEPHISYIYCWCFHRNFHLLYETWLLIMFLEFYEPFVCVNLMSINFSNMSAICQAMLVEVWGSHGVVDYCRVFWDVMPCSQVDYAAFAVWHGIMLEILSSKTCVFRLVLVYIAFEIESWVIIFNPKLRTRCRIVIISETFFCIYMVQSYVHKTGCHTQRRCGHWELVNLLSLPRIEA